MQNKTLTSLLNCCFIRSSYIGRIGDEGVKSQAYVNPIISAHKRDPVADYKNKNSFWQMRLENK